MSKKKKKNSSKPRRRPKHGHYCFGCERRRPNEQFSRRGHAIHICRKCAIEQRAERKREQAMQVFGPEYLANRSRVVVDLNYENWRFYPWQKAFDQSIFEEHHETEIDYFAWGCDYSFGPNPYYLYNVYGIDEDADDITVDYTFRGDWDLLIRGSAAGDRGTLRRYKAYLEMARMLALAVAPFPEVQSIVLFGDFAKPPMRETNVLQPDQPGPFRLPDGLDLAIQLSSMENLHLIRQLRAKLFAERTGRRIKLSEEKFRFHIVDSETSQYLGCLCMLDRCPGDHPDCQGEKCGRPAFVKPVFDWPFGPDLLTKENSQVLYDRKLSERKCCDDDYDDDCDGYYDYDDRCDYDDYRRCENYDDFD